MLSGNYLIFLFVGTCTLFATGLLETGQNVIKKTRLVKVLDKYPMNWMTDWNCEADFPVETCQRIRSQQIDIELVHIYTEELTCRAGWSASSPTDSGCTSPCQADSYGENCAFKCSCLYGRNCDPVDGSCDCFDGFTGHDCSTRCGDGEFGPNCQNQTHICENRGINHPVSGECLCPNGYRGDTCQIACSPFTDPLCGFDCELCSRLINTLYCDHIASSCRCKPGWRGLFCTEPCAPGTSGLFCQDFCCSGNGFCDEEHDRCLCLDGYSGDTCQYKCDNGFFGRDCKERCTCPSCHHVTGTCDMCPHGYFGDGCLELCPSDRWGPSCNQSCACPSGERCDVFTGHCPQENKDGDLTTEKWQLSNRTDSRTDIIPLTTTRRADEGTTSSRVVVISISLLVVLAIISFILLFAFLCHRRSTERRKTFTAAEPPTRVIDNLRHEKENVSNQRTNNLYHLSGSTIALPDENPDPNVSNQRTNILYHLSGSTMITLPAENPNPPPEYSTLDPATANAYNTTNNYMTLNAESPGYASIGQ